MFLPGNYSLETSIMFTSLNSLTLAGDSSSLPQVTTSIVCSQLANIVFSNMAELFITDIKLVSCSSSFNASVQLDQVFQASIVNCNFQGGQRGALIVFNSNVHLSNNTFENNSASVGGAVYIESSHVNISDNLFSNNIAASTDGGGVYIEDSTANISGNNFTNNIANGDGGGVYLTNSTVSFDSNLFKNNTASYGGGIEVYRNSNVSATNNTFTRNTAGIAGGGIDIYSGVVATFMDNILEYNQAQMDGGGFSVTSAGSTVSFTLDSFISNSVERWGGGVYLENCTVSFNSNLFKNNTASYGGGIEVYRNSNVSATNNTFTRNTAGIAGGGIDIYSGVVATFMDNILEYNQAQVDGGGISVTSAGSTVSFTLDSFISNSASRWGGGVYLENCTVSFNSNLFKNNTASYGGGIEVYRNSNVSATNNTFTRNTAGIAGGGIDIDSGVVATFMDNILEYNQAQVDGGGFAVTSAGSTVSFTLDSFISNTADKAGGGIWIIDGIINVTKSNFTGNSAGRRGGGSYLKSGTANFHENVLINNSALFNGAGIYIALDTGSIECTNNTFRNNWGGGWVLFIEDSNRTSAVLSQNTFENNTGNVVYGSSKETPSIYHITPSPDTLCPNEPCLTISEFIDQANQYIALNTTLMFLPGTHTVKCGLLVEGIASLTLLGMDSNSSVDSLPMIICDRPVSLGFKYIDELLLRSLAFDSCGDGTYAAISVTSVSKLEISDCSFKNSVSSGGAVVVANCDMLLITKNVFENNSAVVGGGLYVNESTVNFIGNTFTNNIAALRGAGIALLNCRATFTGMVTFRNNSDMSNGREIVKSDREFREGFLSLTSVGTRSTGGAMFIYKSDVTFGEISVENNIATYGGGICVFGSTVSFDGLADFVNNHAEDSGGAVYAIDGSQLYFEGTSSFKYNTALNGGGLYLADSSLCYFSVTARQLYSQNYARNTGGAIYVSDTTPSVYCDENSASEDLKSLCFFQVQTDKMLFFQSEIQTMISFSNNTANVGGGDLYGGTIDNCKLSRINICLYICEFQSSGDVFNTITTGELDIASVPLRVCYCEHQTPDCSQSLAVELYPGENFDVFVTVFGQRNATVPTVIQAQLSENIKIKEFQDAQNTAKLQLCSKFSFTVFSAESEHGNLTLSIDSPCDHSFMIQIYMKKCPHGFQLSTPTNTCICDERLTEKFTEKCDIETGIVRPNGSEFWVGYDNDSDGLILHPQCPFDYCTEVEQVVNVDDSDTQCNYNRTGKLCGGCGGNTSLVLGSSRCMQCSNSYLALIIPFAIAGIALVLFLFILKLTVAVGTINGLIVYANLVQVNSSVFYKSVHTNLLTVFISWLNLDLGIETCFYNGMDVYAKTWLQFVFPIYVWSLVGVIIFISHFSRKITSLLGSNPIAVLATLFLISYAKILRTIIAALSFRYLEYPDGYVVVWAYDGNMEYFSGKHIPLFITALLSLIFLFLPFTLLLFLGQRIQTLQAMTEWRILSWINKPTFRAFLDAYHAPYANSHRYWTGLLLLVRCILLIIFATIGNTSANLLAISSAVTGLITFALAAAGIYQKHYFGILEASFFLNLVLLTTATYHVKAAGGNQAAVTLISLSIAFITFAGIVVYHVFLQIRGTEQWEKVARVYSNRLSKKSRTIQLLGTEENTESDEASVATTYVELREPLLDDN